MSVQNQNQKIDHELAERATHYAERARHVAEMARATFRELRTAPLEVRNGVLELLADLLSLQENRSRIFAANEKDLKAAVAAGLSDAMQDRLKLTDARIDGIAGAVREIARFPDPVGEIISGFTLANGIEMKKKRVPLGVVFTVYESRPNVTVDVGALCIKSGNAAILRGGKEAFHSNTALYEIFRDAVTQKGLPADSIQLLDDTDRAYMLALLERDDLIDLVVPRGGEALIRFVSTHTRIPVVKHDKGVCNLFIDAAADPDVALSIAVNAKLHRPSVCNAIENLVIHEGYPGTADLLRGLKKAGVDLSGCEKTRKHFGEVRPIEDEAEEYATEFLDARLSVKMVANIDEALEFIYRYGSGHSEAIVSLNTRAVDRFVASVDSAAVFVNCSTRFHDGGEMGMGAEVGISTGRLHVRGPMGVRDLTTTTYILSGDGQIRK